MKMIKLLWVITIIKDKMLAYINDAYMDYFQII